MSVQLFCVFHNKLSQDLQVYPKDMITFVAVNEDIPKDIDSCKDYKCIYEYKLSKYDKLFQDCGYNESSAIVHIGLNGLHNQYEYVGFCQYDNIIYFNSNQLNKNTCLHTSSGTFDVKNRIFPIQDYLECYNKYFQTSITEQDISRIMSEKQCSIPIWSTFIIHKTVYERLWKFLLVLMYHFFTKIKVEQIGSHRHVGSCMEFAIGITLILDSELIKFSIIPIRLLGNKEANYQYANGEDGDGIQTPRYIIDKYVNKPFALISMNYTINIP